MARKRPFENPPPNSSSENEDDDDDQVEESSEENNSDEDDDEPKSHALEDEEEEGKTPLSRQKIVSGKGGSDSGSDSDNSLPSPKKRKEDVSTQVSYGSEEGKVNFWKDFKFKQWGHARAFQEKLAEHMGGVIGRDLLREMERKDRKLRIKEIEVYLMRLELLQELAQAALDHLKGSKI